MPLRRILGVTKHTDLTDKEVAGVIDHADASVTNTKIASGLDASKITTGVLPVAQVPDLDASKITTGVFASARIPLHWERIAEVDVDADTTQITVTGLDINAHKCYLIFLIVKNPTGSFSKYNLFVENDLTETNYYHQWLEASGTAVGASRVNDARCLVLSGGDSGACVVCLFRDTAGYPRFTTHQTRRIGASITV